MLAILMLLLAACQEPPADPANNASETADMAADTITDQPATESEATGEQAEPKPADQLLAKYADFTLTSDLSHLSANQKQLLPVLIEDATIMDDLFGYKVMVLKSLFWRKLKILP